MCPGSAPLKRQAELFFPPEFADDFPVAMQISERYGLVYVVTKLGLLVRGRAQTPCLVLGFQFCQAGAVCCQLEGIHQSCNMCHPSTCAHEIESCSGGKLLPVLLSACLRAHASPW